MSSQKINNPEQEIQKTRISDVASAHQRAYADQYYRNPLIAEEKRRLSNLVKHTIKNANIWYAILITGFCGFFLNREIDFVSAIQKWVGKGFIIFQPIRHIANKLMSIRPSDFLFNPFAWEVDTIFTLFVACLLASFLLSNLYADWIAARAQSLHQLLKQAVRASKSSIRPVSTEQYQKNMTETTKKELAKLQNSEEYKTHMENRNSDNWQENQEQQIEAQSEHEQQSSDQIPLQGENENQDVDSVYSRIHQEVNTNIDWNRDFKNQVPDGKVRAIPSDPRSELFSKVKNAHQNQLNINKVNQSEDEIRID